MRSLPLLVPVLVACLSPYLGASPVYPGQLVNPGASPAPAPVVALEDTFAPPTSSAAPAAGSPTLGEWIHQAQPGDSVPFTGLFAQPTTFTVFGQTNAGNAVFLTATAILQNSLQAQIQLPACLPPNSAYLVWATNASGTSAPACLNCTELWWGLDAVRAGDTASLFGRNLAFGGVTPTVYVQTPGQAGTVAQLLDYNNYRIDYVMPAVASGASVQVWVHNGHGGSYGWAGPLSVAVQTTVNDETAFWTGATFNVKDFGAVGDGVTDDGPAITMALTNAAQSYSSTGLPATVYLPGSPAGTTYLTDEGFDNLNHVRWMGDGPTQTSVVAGPTFNSNGLFYESSGQVGRGDDVEIEGMTLDMNDNFQGAALANIGYNLLFEVGVNYLKLYNLVIRSGEPLSGTAATSYGSSTTLMLDGEASHVWVQDCAIYGGDMMFEAQNQVFVDHCQFYGQYDAGGFTGSNGGTGFSLTNCTAQDYANVLTFTADVNQDPNPWYFEGRLFAGGGRGDHDDYFSGNTTINCAPRVGTGNSLNAGEQILWEGGATSYSGPITSAGAGTVQIPASGTAYGADSAGREYYYVVVVAGDGLGQHRQVTGDNGSGLLDVSPNWNVVPDGTSTIQVQTLNENAAVYANQLQGKPGYATSGTSSVGVEPYLNCFGFSVDTNHISQMVTGLNQWSSIDSGGLHPGYFNLFTGNSVTNSTSAVAAQFENWTSTAINGIGLLGIDFRRNTLGATNGGTMATGVEEVVTDSTGYSPRMSDNVVDQNSVTGPVGSDFPTPAPAEITDTAYVSDSPNCGQCLALANVCSAATPSPVASPSPAPPSPTRTPTGTPTSSPTRTESPSGTPTGTPTDTPTGTPTATPMATATASPSATSTGTDSPTGTPTAQATATATPTRTPTASQSPTPAATETPTSVPTAAASGAPAGTTPEASPSPMATPEPTSTDVPDAPLVILSLLPVPNPNPRALSLDMEGPADSAAITIYSATFALVARVTSGPLATGWNQTPLSSALSQAPDGLYFAEAVALRGGQKSPPAFTRMLVLR